MPDNCCPNLPIECQRLRLRDFHRGDLEQFTQYRENPDIARYQGWDMFCMDDALKLYEVLQGLRFGVPLTWYQIAISDLRTDAIVGDCVIYFTRDNSTVDIGFTLAPQVHGIGYAHEAISRLIELVFVTLGKQRIIAVTHAHNVAAHRLLGRLGFDQREHDSDDPEPELMHTLSLARWKILQDGDNNTSPA